MSTYNLTEHRLQCEERQQVTLAAGSLASSGQIRVNQTLAAAPQAFLNATINLNRPAAVQGPAYVFAAGTQICIPNFFPAQPAAGTAAASQSAATAGGHGQSPATVHLPAKKEIGSTDAL